MTLSDCTLTVVPTPTGTLQRWTYGDTTIVCERDRGGTTWFAATGGFRSPLYASADAAMGWLGW